MTLPANFQWINTIGVIPKMVQEGIKLLGIKEIKGAQSNPEILKFAKEIGVSNIYKNDDTSWCAVSHIAVALRAGKTVNVGLVKIDGKRDLYDRLRALKFAVEGEKIDLDDWEIIERTQAMFGDTIIITRPGGGHIGIYIGESKTHLYIMGGNQNNMYSFTRVAKERLYAVRRPKYKIGTPPSVKKYFLNDNGVPITTNES